MRTHKVLRSGRGIGIGNNGHSMSEAFAPVTTRDYPPYTIDRSN